MTFYQYIGILRLQEHTSQSIMGEAILYDSCFHSEHTDKPFEVEVYIEHGKQHHQLNQTQEGTIRKLYDRYDRLLHVSGKNE